MSQRGAMLGKIHIGVKELGLPDDDYRDMLDDLYGVRSAGKLNDGQLAHLCAHLEKLGFTPKRKPQASRAANAATQAQLTYIKSLWDKYARSKGLPSLERWLRKYFKVDKLQWVPRDKASQIIVALEGMAE